MRFVTDEDIRRTRAEALMAGEGIDKSPLWEEIEWEKRSLSDLAILRPSFQALLDETDRQIADRVARARILGSPWSEIGGILGMTRQAAQQKFG